MLTALKHWPTHGCIHRGWSKTAEGWPPESDSHLRYQSASFWTLGKSECFYVKIFDCYGVTTGHGESVADVLFKIPGEKFKILPQITLQNPDDILGVINTLQKQYADSDSIEAREWKACMSEFDIELKAAEATEHIYDTEEELRPNDIPEFLEEILKEWRYTEVDDDTPAELMEAYIRVERSWTGYSSWILGILFGDMYREELERSDRIGFLLDRKIRQTKDVGGRTSIMNLYRMMMPCYIGTDEDIEQNNVDYEKSWSKTVAQEIVSSAEILSAPKVELLLRVREDNKRLPTAISKFIKTEIPRYLESERERLDAVETPDSTSVCDEIYWLDNYRHALRVMGKEIERLAEKGEQARHRIDLHMETEDDIKAMSHYADLLTKRYGTESTESAREKLLKRIESRLKQVVRTSDTQPSKAMAGDVKAIRALVERFTLGAIYLELLFEKRDDQDIDTYFWNLHEHNLWEQRMEKESRGGFDFDFFGW